MNKTDKTFSIGVVANKKRGSPKREQRERVRPTHLTKEH